jgi:Flp pilus assembly pilin Flp
MRVPTDRQIQSERGQTFTEYTMVLGLLAAIIVAVTGIIVPGVRLLIARLVFRLVVFMGSGAA